MTVRVRLMQSEAERAKRQEVEADRDGNILDTAINLALITTGASVWIITL